MLLPAITYGQKLDVVRRDIESIVKPVQGTFAVAFESLDGKGQLLLNEKVMFHAASTMKTPVMIEVYRQSKEERFSLDDSLVVKNEFKRLYGKTLEAFIRSDCSGHYKSGLLCLAGDSSWR